MDYESEDGRDQDDDDEFEEAGGSNRLLGFMFGNVDNAGDLDVDYLDEDAKEHLAALADKLGPSLTDIDLSVKSPQTPGDASDQDFDKKAEDALNFEDIEEPYEGPETEAATEEDYLLPKKEFFSSIASAATLVHTKPILDDENYDEDEETEAEVNISGSQTVSISGEHAEDPISIHEEKSSKDDSPVNFPEAETLVSDLEDMQEDLQVIDDPYHSKSSTPLPILCIEDGMVILRFSEIFGIHEPLKKGARKDRSYEFPREARTQIDAYDVVEDDEEAFLKGCCQGFSVVKQALVTQDDVSEKLYESELENFGIGKGVVEISNRLDSQGKASFCSAQPMKEDASVDLSATCQSQHCPEFYPIDQQDWEERIIWGNSPAASDHSFDSSDIVGLDPDTIVSGAELDTGSRPHNFLSDVLMEPVEKDSVPFFPSSSVIVEPFGSRYPGFADRFSKSRCHPQLLRLESRMELDDTNDSNSAEGLHRSNARKHLNDVALKNRDILEGSWLDKIIWDPDKPVAKPKLILDLRDEQMLFEVFDSKDAKHLRLHAGAMIIAHSMKSGIGEPCELQCHAGPLGRFNIANDKFYSNRKTSQQLKSHSKKRTAHGIKVLHSIPALQLLTMKPKLSNKNIANFHRPKGIWYPHDNEMAMKELGKLDTYGPMKIILKNLGGKGIKLHVDVEETISSVKGKASKKLDFKPSEIVKIYYVGNELEDSKTLAAQNVRPNSVLHLVRTKIHVLSRAQRLPGENKSLRPPGAFKKKSDLSAKDGHIFLMEYCEERPLLLGNVGMGARLCTYYQKSAPGDQTGSHLRNDNSNLGTILTLDPADKSPFLGEIKPGCSQSCLETNMYRAPIFPHKVSSTDYLLVRSAKGKLSIRRIDRIHIVGQQEPHMEVMSPGSKGLQTYIMNRLLVYMYRGFHALEKCGLPPHIRADELSAQFPNISEPFLRKRLKHCADLQRPRGEYFWIMRRNFRIPLEEELRRMVTPENVCAYESMLAGHHRLKRLGITKLTNPAGLSAAMNQLPYEAIALAAAAHIERELQITPWNLSSNFVSCTSQDRGNIERLEITGVGDPSGRGLGFSYVRTAPKAPIPSAVVKKKISVSRGGSTVTGTDADLRRLSMEAAREVLLKFNVPDEQIAKQTRWHRIAMIRKLSSEQAASGVKVDPTTISKYARGQRMSFLQLQQQTREKCQEIWDRQFQSLSVIEGDENDSDSEANSDLDSFAGDLENLLDAEGCEEGDEGNCESQRDKTDGVKGLKMRRHQSQTQEDEIEDEEAEAADLCRILMDDDVSDRKKKKKTKAMGDQAILVRRSQTTFGIANDDRITKSTAVVKHIICATQPNGAYASKESIQYPKDVDTFHAKKKVAGTPKGMRKKDIPQILLNKKVKIMGDGVKMIKEKKSARETFVCGACGQLGHMRTNKNCPKYGEDHEIHAEIAYLENRSGKSNSVDLSALPQQKPLVTKTLEKSASKNSLADALEGETCSSTVKPLPVKFKCGGTVSAEKFPELATPGISSGAEHPGTSQSEPAMKSATKVTKIIISNKMKAEDAQVESHKPSIVIRPPAETDRERTRKKIVIKRPKEIINLDQISQDGSIGHEYRKTKKMVELSSFERHTRQESMSMDEEATKRKAMEEKKWWEEEEKRRNEERQKEEKARKRNEEMRFLEEQERLSEIRRYEEAIRNEREEEERQKAKKRKKKVKKIEIRDDYLVEDYRARRNELRLPVRDVTTKRRSLIESARNNEYTQPTKRRRSGEVGLANILERIVDILRDRQEVSYLFLKPVSRKEAPDYLDIIERPMDLSTIKEKVRRMEYKHHSEFSHDVWQISYNAHKYNDGRNPGIPPLADQLLEICEYLIIENEAGLAEAEDSIARSG